MKRDHSLIKLCCFCDLPMECIDLKTTDDRIMYKFKCKECGERSEITELTRVKYPEDEYPE